MTVHGSERARPCVDLQLESNAAFITLDDPEHANRLSSDMVEELGTRLREAAQSASLVVLRASGRNFCGGFDVADPDRVEARFIRIASLIEELRRLPVVTAAVVQGHAIGAGADLVTHCDLRIGLPDSDFRFPGLRGFGVILGTERLASLIGSARALEVTAFDQVLGAEKARAAGILTHVMSSTDARMYLRDMGEALGRLPAATCSRYVQALREVGTDRDRPVSALAESLTSRSEPLSVSSLGTSSGSNR